MKPPHEHRHDLYKRAQARPLHFPRAVAWLFATVYEPRQEHSECPEPFIKQLRDIQRQLRDTLFQISANTTDVRQEAGKLEETCRTFIQRLRAAAEEHELADVIEQLDHALAVSHGQRQPPPLREKDPVSFQHLPEPQIVKPGRPPVGYWR